MTRRLLFALVALLRWSAAEVAQDGSVLVLDQKSFKETIAASQFVLVMFHAPWCGHCKQFAPEFAMAAKQLKEVQPPVVCAKVDATTETQLAEEYNVRGYPTIKLFVDGKDQEYTGGRTNATIVTWMLKKVGPPAVKLEDVAGADQFEREHSLAVIGLFEEGTELPSSFKAVARQLEDVMFAYSTVPIVAAKFALIPPAVRMLLPHDEKVVDFSGDLESASDLEAWVRMYRMPSVTLFDGEIAPELFSDGRPILFLFRDKGPSGEAAEKAVRDAVPALQRKLLVSLSGSHEPMEQRLMDYVAVVPEELPTLRIVTDAMSNMVKFKLEGEISTTSVTEFVHQFQMDKLQPFLRSEPVPALQSEAVYSLVGSTFDSIVKDDSKDVLVEFYAPWCGHCKKFEPVYQEVANKLEGVNTLIVAKIDGTANDVDGLDVEGYPMIKLWRAHNKEEPLEYDGDRVVDSLIKWLEEHSSFAFNQAELKSEL